MSSTETVSDKASLSDLPLFEKIWSDIEECPALDKHQQERKRLALNSGGRFVGRASIDPAIGSKDPSASDIPLLSTQYYLWGPVEPGGDEVLDVVKARWIAIKELDLLAFGHASDVLELDSDLPSWTEAEDEFVERAIFAPMCRRWTPWAESNLVYVDHGVAKHHDRFASELHKLVMGVDAAGSTNTKEQDLTDMPKLGEGGFLKRNGDMPSLAVTGIALRQVQPSARNHHRGRIERLYLLRNQWVTGPQCWQYQTERFIQHMFHVGTLRPVLEVKYPILAAGLLAFDDETVNETALEACLNVVRPKGPKIPDDKVCVVRSEDSETLVIDVHPETTVLDIKVKIEAAWNTPVNVQRLVTNGIQLEDDTRLSSYRIKVRKGHRTLSLVYFLRGLRAPPLTDRLAT